MSGSSTKTVTNINDLRSKEKSCKNSWIIGISTRHPGQKYYFNTVTNVSVWNISMEDMELAQQHLGLNGNQSQYENCPEPMEPPPIRTVTPKPPAEIYCGQALQGLKFNKRRPKNRLACSMSELAHEVCCSPMNQIQFNSHMCPECTSQSNNMMPQNEVPISPVYNSFNALSFQTNNFHNGYVRRPVNKEDNEFIIEDSTNDKSDSDDESFENNSNCNIFNLEPLKCYMKSGTVEGKWFIIADAYVYLHNRKFLKNVLNSNQNCSLMVPQNVKTELEIATKSHLQTKAYCANYFIHKLVDIGGAVIDEDLLDPNDGKTNKEHLLDCSSKLKAQNCFVVLITNDAELIKSRHKVFIPIFMVSELKEFLRRQNCFFMNKSSESPLNFLHNKKNRETTPNLLCETQFFDKDKGTNANNIWNGNRNVPTVSDLKDIKTQKDIEDSPKTTADAAVQTEISLTLLKEMVFVYNTMYLNNQNKNRTKREVGLLGNNKSFRPSSCNNDLGKPIKLRRDRINKKPCSNNLVVPSQSHPNSCNYVDVCIPNYENSLIDNLETDKTYSSNTKSIKCKWKNNVNTTLNTIGEEMRYTLKRKMEEDTIKEKANKRIHLERTNHLKHNPNKNNGNEPKENVEYKNVMFEITSENMRESLNTKSEEWVSRFVQIMEEVLTHVLRKYSVHSPLPLNVYEATECIRKNYKDDFDVADASTKLLNVFNYVSDEKGNINVNMRPEKYMEMYSFGVYLIDALQAIMSTLEDLQIAAQSLSKLLSDIQGADLDQSNIESHHDTSQEVFLNNDDTHLTSKVEAIMDKEKPPNNLREVTTNDNEIYSDKENDGYKGPVHFQMKLKVTEGTKENGTIKDYKDSKASPVDCNHRSLDMNKSDSHNMEVQSKERKTACELSPNTNNFRSLSWKKTIVNNLADQRMSENDNINTTLCTKNIFFRSLALYESLSAEKPDNNFRENLPDNIEVSKNVESSHNLENVEGSCSQVNSCVSNMLEREEPAKQRIVRNFVRCSEIDEWFRNQQMTNFLDNYNSGQGHMETEDTEDEFYDYESEFENDDVANTNSDERLNAGNESDVKIYFKCLINKLAQEVKDVSAAVHAFSSNCIEQLESSTYDKKYIQQKAEEADLYIHKLCLAFIRILFRDRNSNYKLQEILQNKQFSDAEVNTALLELYGTFVTRCLEQVQELRPVIKNILSAVRD